MIVCENIKKSFGENIVIDGFTHTFAEGSRCCIMGPSGCGKTTLARILLGTLPPDSGTVTGAPAKKAAVFQEDRLFERFTAYGNIAAVCKSKSKTEILSILAALGLDKSAALCPVKELSGGMRRRVAIARALAVVAPLVIMDEPFSGLDTENHSAAAGVILEYTAGSTLIVVTHDTGDAELLGAETVYIG